MEEILRLTKVGPIHLKTDRFGTETEEVFVVRNSQCSNDISIIEFYELMQMVIHIDNTDNVKTDPNRYERALVWKC